MSVLILGVVIDFAAEFIIAAQIPTVFKGIAVVGQEPEVFKGFNVRDDDDSL